MSDNCVVIHFAAANMETVGRGEGGRRYLHSLFEESALSSTNQKHLHGEYKATRFLIYHLFFILFF